MCATRGVRPPSVFIGRVDLLNVSRKYNTDDDLQNTCFTSFNQIINMLQSIQRFVFFFYFILHLPLFLSPVVARQKPLAGLRIHKVEKK